MAIRVQAAGWMWLLLIVGVNSAAGQNVVASPADIATIVQRMEQAALDNRAHYRPYVMTRRYRTYGSEEEVPKSEVTAEVSFIPPTHKEFRILQANGSTRAEGVVRHILEDESKAAATGAAPGAITRENYDFSLLGSEKLDGRDCFVLGLSPKRKDKALVQGRAWVDRSTFLVHRVDGEMSKLPSWWLKSVHVTLDFSESEGMWLQQGMRAVAQVRLAGTHVLTSEALHIEAAGVVAQAPAAGKGKARPFARSDTLVGSGILRH